MSTSTSRFSRRRFVQLAAAAAGAGVAGGLTSPRAHGETPAPVPPEQRKLLFVFCAYGGAGVIDSFMPIADTEVGDAELASRLNVFPESLIEQRAGSNLRSVKILEDGYAYYAKPSFPMGDLLTHHGDDVVVMAHEVTSVNHNVGQQRSLNGGGLDRGRTIMETAAMRYGGGLPLPSCNMASDGYLKHGADPNVPPEARHELITTPGLFAASTHGYKALDGAPGDAAMARARAVRADLDANSAFGRTFKNDERLIKYLHARENVIPKLEQAALIEKLLLLDRSKIDARFGVGDDPLIATLQERLPKMDSDKAQAQVALGFLMAYHGVSTSITMGYNTDPLVDPSGAIFSAPFGFDFAHNLHRIVQSMMWCRTANFLDTLITLLKTHDYLGDPKLGKMWDRSLIYVATEFGRDKVRPKGASSWGTSHHLNNGSVLISPLLKGNAVYGGVDPKTGLTFGFDPDTGKPDKNRTFYEGDVYSVIAQAMGIDFPNMRRFPAIVRGA